MKYKMIHNNLNVFDLEKSLNFYNDALHLTEKRRITAEDGSYIIVYLGDEENSQHLLELTYIRDMERPYELGDNEFHLAFESDNYEEAKAYHKEKGYICYENDEMGIYFISDPDGYWLEVLPAK